MSSVATRGAPRQTTALRDTVDRGSCRFWLWVSVVEVLVGLAAIAGVLLTR